MCGLMVKCFEPLRRGNYDYFVVLSSLADMRLCYECDVCVSNG